MSADLGFVLIHGGGVSGAFWDRLPPYLHHPAVAVDLPGRRAKPFDPMALTVDECVGSVLADIAASEIGGVILVAHSSGGLFVPGVGNALGPRLRHVVLSAASVPPEGGMGLDCMKASHRERTVAGIEAARREGWTLTTPGPPADREQLRGAYGGDPLDDDTLDFVFDPVRNVKDSMNIYFQPVGSWKALSDVPVTYVKNLRDRPLPAELQQDMIERLPRAPEVIELDVGHIPAVTHPEVFAGILERVAVAYDR